MPRVIFTGNLARHIEAPAVAVTGRTVRELLDSVFADNPRLRGYVLDEQNALRKHMNVFINGVQIHDRNHLTDAVPEQGEVYVLQALSGGQEGMAHEANLPGNTQGAFPRR